jgi:uncharacterized membrane protein YoaK (UPF0700 family)
MKTIATTMLLALVILPLSAQTNSCPLQPVFVKNLASQVSVSLQNTSGKQVGSYRVGLTFYDVNGKIHAFPHSFSDNIALKSHGKRTAIWHTSSSHQFLFPLAQAYLLDATFADGTTWADDGTHACSVTSAQE